MTINPTSVRHRTVRLSVGLIAVATLAACGNSAQVSSGPGVASAAAPEAAYVSPEQADRAATLAIRNASGSDEELDRSAKLDLGSALARQAIERREASAAIDWSAKLDLTSALARERIALPEAPYVSSEQQDKDSMLALRNAMGSADALERRATVGQSSALGSADALERQGLTDHSSAHRSADALEHWALSDSGG